jgi:hypothetical protein
MRSLTFRPEQADRTPDGARQSAGEASWHTVILTLIFSLMKITTTKSENGYSMRRRYGQSARIIEEVNNP